MSRMFHVSSSIAMRLLGKFVFSMIKEIEDCFARQTIRTSHIQSSGPTNSELSNLINGNCDTFCFVRGYVKRDGGSMQVPEVQWTGARLIAVLSLLGQQQQFHAFAFASQRGGPFFASPLVDPLQPLPNPLQPLPNPLQPRDPLSSFRHAMPGNCQSRKDEYSNNGIRMFDAIIGLKLDKAAEDMSQFGLSASNSWGYGSTAGYAGYLPGPLSSCAAQAAFVIDIVAFRNQRRSMKLASSCSPITLNRIERKSTKFGNASSQGSFRPCDGVDFARGFSSSSLLQSVEFRGILIRVERIFGGLSRQIRRFLFSIEKKKKKKKKKKMVPDSTTPGQSDPLDPLSSLMSATPSQRYQDYVSPRSLSTDSSTTESPVHEEQGFGQNYGNYFPTPGVLPSILYSQLYGNQFQNSESPEQRAVADSCSVRQEEVRPDNNEEKWSFEKFLLIKKIGFQVLEEAVLYRLLRELPYHGGGDYFLKGWREERGPEPEVDESTATLFQNPSSHRLLGGPHPPWFAIPAPSATPFGCSLTAGARDPPAAAATATLGFYNRSIIAPRCRTDAINDQSIRRKNQNGSSGHKYRSFLTGGRAILVGWWWCWQRKQPSPRGEATPDV
ncbi:hypothetical protein WN51_02834 [Melipona quadrifasciata]|uniref:Uncharacterized protein n=1 Tax=Melipona quadrifasciata TaxID=166423 RepID=A0A0N0BJT0_9HYME|nr:hypothetical protein WN51_02834 [Melipona quadrifasciata]